MTTAVIVLIGLVVFGPYLAFPLVMAYKMNKKGTVFPFLSTALALFCWPILLMWLNSLASPSSQEGRCLTPEASFIFLNVCFLIPVGLIVQFVAMVVFRKIEHNDRGE